MGATRREFLRYASGAGVGTALGGLVGLGLTLAPARAKAQQLRIKDSRTVPSICPFCAVGCGTLIHVKDGEIYQLHKNPNRPTTVLHRRPGATGWETVDLDWAMGRVAELVKKTRDE